MTKSAKHGAKAKQAAGKKKAEKGACCIDMDHIDDSDVGSFFDSDSDSDSEPEMPKQPKQPEQPAQKRKKAVVASKS